MLGFTRKQLGVGLIELLVTVLILSTCLVALTALQSRSLQFNHSAYLRSQANIIAYDILDRIRINQGGMADYSIGLGDDSPTEDSLSATDLREWRTNIASVLPGGRGAVMCDATSSICRIVIDWSEQNSSDDASEDVAVFTYTTRI